ncbi:hypothetical protein CCHL11_02464 [Colletotrichum chlorophyti]|uniref:Methyltransferase n=1 Tax=Colletotrichum chlorophyti TaxID=708187 RepID=A0A1Q8S615_9PEZI|nr:hypothetical protein CCHL11_02464 [Colletotrichum chlorophyti]
MPSKFKDLLVEAGFEDVVQVRQVWPTSPWPADRKLRQLGWWSQASSLAGIEASTLALWTRVLGWTLEDTKAFCAEVAEELKTTQVHAYWNV